MGGRPAGPVTAEEAKDRLRKAAGEAGPGAWIRRHPLGAIATGMVGGFLIGSLSRETREELGRAAIRLFLHR